MNVEVVTIATALKAVAADLRSVLSPRARLYEHAPDDVAYYQRARRLVGMYVVGQAEKRAAIVRQSTRNGRQPKRLPGPRIATDVHGAARAVEGKPVSSYCEWGLGEAWKYSNHATSISMDAATHNIGLIKKMENVSNARIISRSNGNQSASAGNNRQATFAANHSTSKKNQSKGVKNGNSSSKGALPFDGTKSSNRSGALCTALRRKTRNNTILLH